MPSLFAIRPLLPLYTQDAALQETSSSDHIAKVSSRECSHQRASIALKFPTQIEDHVQLDRFNQISTISKHVRQIYVFG